METTEATGRTAKAPPSPLRVLASLLAVMVMTATTMLFGALLLVFAGLGIGVAAAIFYVGFRLAWTAIFGA